MIWNHLPAPDQDKPEVIAKRAVARAKAAAPLEDLTGSKVLSRGPVSYSAYCVRGENNFKRQEGYRHDCYAAAAQFHSWSGPFPAMARALHKELREAGWKSRKYLESLPDLAAQYESGRNPYDDKPTPGVPVVLDFSEMGWSSCYDKGESHICFEFADRNTDVDSQTWSLDIHQSRRPRLDSSYAEHSETVDSKATMDSLLQHDDGVVFVYSEEPYFSIQS
ncbi:MAG: hypothetical protein IPL43_09870 [Micropruina sp.]|nr:hypothetical protein [Micropruina sp.]